MIRHPGRGGNGAPDRHAGPTIGVDAAMRVTIETPDLSPARIRALAHDWRDLERRSSCSFFQSWSWIGCRVGERFDAPRLVRATANGATVGLALFNRHKLRLARGVALDALWLHQTGDPAEDSVFVEHNGPLVADSEPGAARAMLRTALRECGLVILNGIGDPVRQAARGLGVRHERECRDAPYASLQPDGAAAWQARLGGSTRAQLGRSRRRIEAHGPVSWHRAQDEAEADAFLDGLAALHQRSWTGRGCPGAFAEPAFRRFHAGLIQHALPRGEVALWRLASGGVPLAYLYNFHWQDTVLAYQSGIDTGVPGTSPGLVAHARAVADAASSGAARYDFLGGDVRYKRSLGDEAVTLHWIELASLRHARGWLVLGLRILSALRRRIASRRDGAHTLPRGACRDPANGPDL